MQTLKQGFNKQRVIFEHDTPQHGWTLAGFRKAFTEILDHTLSHRIYQIGPHLGAAAVKNILRYRVGSFNSLVDAAARATTDTEIQEAARQYRAYTKRKQSQDDGTEARFLETLSSIDFDALNSTKQS